MNFEDIYKINVNEYVEEKNGLSYLTWSFAWREFKKIYPEATYEIKRFENNLPYVYDENTGYMVFTSVTVENLTYEMWLPVMDGANKSMKNKPYNYKVKEYKYGKFTGNYLDKTVDPATMFDINKTIMRCLVKNLAMFGLGLYIYAGEDLPEIDTPEPIKNINEQQIKILQTLIKSKENATQYYDELRMKYKVHDLKELTENDFKNIIEEKDK